jgi:hypothetical protein
VYLEGGMIYLGAFGTSVRKEEYTHVGMFLPNIIGMFIIVAVAVILNEGGQSTSMPRQPKLFARSRAVWRSSSFPSGLAAQDCSRFRFWRAQLHKRSERRFDGPLGWIENCSLQEDFTSS